MGKSWKSTINGGSNGKTLINVGLNGTFPKKIQVTMDTPNRPKAYTGLDNLDTCSIYSTSPNYLLDISSPTGACIGDVKHPRNRTCTNRKIGYTIRMQTMSCEVSWDTPMLHIWNMCAKSLVICLMTTLGHI